jgi:hypothetical protein
LPIFPIAYFTQEHFMAFAHFGPRAAVTAALAITLPSGAGAQDLAGYVGPNGKLLAPVTSFTTARTGKGAYTMTFKKALTRSPVCEYLPFGNNGQIAITGISYSSTSCGVQFIDMATGKPADAAFVFHAVPISK